jgi:hypothetical protein
MKRTLDEFLEDPGSGAESINASNGMVWIELRGGSVLLEGEFTSDELTQIAAAMVDHKKAAG